MTKISVIIPVYNAQKTINQCLRSIFNQTFKDFEVIVVNDGSTDSSWSILESWQDKIKIFNQAFFPLKYLIPLHSASGAPREN